MCQGIKRQHPARISVNSDCFCPLLVFTARKRSLRRLCFYTCLSVQRGGGEYLARYPPGQLPPRQVHPLGRYTSPRHVHPLGRYTHLGRYPPGQVHPRQVHPLGRYTPLGRYLPWAGTPPGQVHPPQCMLGYGQQAGGTHPTGMHSCCVKFLLL